MKNKIYIAAIALIIISIVLILGFYYTQDFTEEFDFDEAINFSEIETQTRDSGSTTYLNSATATLGKLKLKNAGYFTQKYTAPELVGCVLLKESENGALQFSVSPASTYSPSSRDGQIEVKVGTEREYNLVGQYSSRYKSEPIESFTRQNIEAIKIYKLPEENKNPLAESYKYGYFNDDSCSYLIDNEIALTIISVN